MTGARRTAGWWKKIPAGYPVRFVALAMLALVVVAYCRSDDLRDWMVDDTRFAAEIREAALTHGIEPELVRAVVFQESRFDPFARGSKGEVGLMQVLPRGAVADWARAKRRPAPDRAALADPRLNLEIGCWYLARGMRRWRNYTHGTELALAGYNAGESRAERWKPADPGDEVIPRIAIASTRRYVSRIMKRYRNYLEKIL